MSRPLLHASLALLATAGGPANAATGSGTPACLRGNRVASQGETNRVMRALIPNVPAEVRGPLSMIFRDGALQYGSRQVVYTANFGNVTLIARGPFFALAPYTARRGTFSTSAGELTTEWGG